MKTEIELWFKDAEADRQRVSSSIRVLIVAAGGQVYQEAIVQEIAYHGLLAELPANVMEGLVARQDVALVMDDDIMFLRPQSVLNGPSDLEAYTLEEHENQFNLSGPQLPIADLLDGVPVQAHQFLSDRLIIDDPDDLQSRTLVTHRRHGTSMASLILHGDLNEEEEPLSRPIYVRPILTSSNGEIEHSDTNRLLVDIIHSAVVQMKGQREREGTAPSVFLVNLSLGDTRRPFSRSVSPLVRLLDFLAYKYDLLFLGSVDVH